MQISSFDRAPLTRPVGAEAASAGVGGVIPVAPVNPPERVNLAPGTPAPQSSPGTPGVVDMINPALKSDAAKSIYTSVSDPAQPGSEAATSPKDWTIHRPAPENVEVPPPKPMYEVLIDHLTTMWTAGASAIQIEQVSKQLTPPPVVSPTDAPGTLAKEALVYTPSKIPKAGDV
jgi:hypothetical protein